MMSSLQQLTLSIRFLMSRDIQKTSRDQTITFKFRLCVVLDPVQQCVRDPLFLSHWNTESIPQFHFRTHFRTISCQFLKQNEQNTQEIFLKI